jgi:hypothetical protein
MIVDFRAEIHIGSVFNQGGALSKPSVPRARPARAFFGVQPDAKPAWRVEDTTVVSFLSFSSSGASGFALAAGFL